MLSIPLKKDTKRCQEKLKEGKTLILKQQKLIRMADREEDGLEVVGFYLSHDLASDSDDEKQLSKDRRRAACNKKKRKAYKHKHRKEQFRNAPFLFTGYALKTSVNQTKDKVISVEKKDISSMIVPLGEQDNYGFTYKRGRVTTEKTKNVTVRKRLNRTLNFGKANKDLLILQKNISNGYTMPFTSITSRFYASNNKSSLWHPQFVSQTITKLLEKN